MIRKTRSPASGAHYIGGRDGLAEVLRPFGSAPVQIIDLVGSSAPTLRQLTTTVDVSRESVIISTRRVHLHDALGDVESTLLGLVPKSIILRCAPLDLSLPLLWAWAQATGILMSAFHQDGVAWIRTSDLAEAVTRISPTQIRERTGQVYDVTGPERVSMTQLRDAMTEQLNESIELACLPPEEFTEKLLANGMPEVVARWVADYQRTSSDPLLPSTTQVLPMLLDRSPASPQLVPHDYQDINYESTHR